MNVKKINSLIEGLKALKKDIVEQGEINLEDMGKRHRAKAVLKFKEIAGLDEYGSNSSCEIFTVRFHPPSEYEDLHSDFSNVDSLEIDLYSIDNKIHLSKSNLLEIDLAIDTAKKTLAKLQLPKTIINLTPHDVNVYDSDKAQLLQTFQKSGKIARVEQSYEQKDSVNDIPLFTTVYGDAIDLPSPEKNTLYIVSLVVAQLLPQRKDLIVPDTNVGAVRNDKGMILGTTRFLQV